MAKAFDSIANGLREAIDLNKGNPMEVRAYRPKEINQAKNADQYVSSNKLLRWLDMSLAKARAKLSRFKSRILKGGSGSAEIDLEAGFN